MIVGSVEGRRRTNAFPRMCCSTISHVICACIALCTFVLRMVYASVPARVAVQLDVISYLVAKIVLALLLSLSCARRVEEHGTVT
jgi:hypothetical protein